MIFALLLIAVGLSLTAAIGGFFTMLTLGVIFSEFGLLAPLGYGTSVVLYALVSATIALATPQSSVRFKGE